MVHISGLGFVHRVIVGVSSVSMGCEFEQEHMRATFKSIRSLQIGFIYDDSLVSPNAQLGIIFTFQLSIHVRTDASTRRSTTHGKDGGSGLNIQAVRSARVATLQ